MRLFLHFVALVALLVAPLAAPAAAFAVNRAAAECDTMVVDGSGHVMPDGEHMQGNACCIAVPAAISPPLAVLDAMAAIDHLAVVAAIVPFHLGAGPTAEDPPPRNA